MIMMLDVTKLQYLEEFRSLGEVGILKFSSVNIRAQIHQHLHADRMTFYALL